MPGSTMGDVSVLALMPQVVQAPARGASKVQTTSDGDFGSVIEDARLSNIKGSNNSLKKDSTLQNTGQTNSQKDVKNKGRTDQDNRIKDNKTDTKKADRGKADKKQTVSKEENKANDLENKFSEISEDVEDAGKELVSEIADELDVTDEEVLEILAQLGLTLTDLFNPENLTQVVMEVTGTEDVSEILMDEDLSHSLQDLMESARKMIEDIATDYDTEPQEIDQMLETLKALNGKEVSGTFEENIKNAKANEPKTLEDKIEIKVEDKSLLTNEQVSETQSEGKQEGSKEFKGENDNLFSQTEEIKTPEMNPYQQMVNDLKNAFNEAVSEASRPQASGTNQVDVINQITDYMKLNVKENLTSMEIQLHPASLGTVKDMVEQAQDGGVTAKFTASTEEAKTALQTQLIQLQHKLDEQGIKVNAVEVAVDAHAFEQNLEKGNQQNASEQEEKRQSRIRRINLGDPDLLQEETLELDEETRLAAEIMAANGQTVDYTA
jgi:flagellar hook-length control protein FliK